MSHRGSRASVRDALHHVTHRLHACRVWQRRCTRNAQLRRHAARNRGQDRRHEARGRDVSWAIWITGRPGTGKTTIAQQVVALLQARGDARRPSGGEGVRQRPRPRACAVAARARPDPSRGRSVGGGAGPGWRSRHHRRDGTPASLARSRPGRESRILPRFSSPVRTPSAQPASRRCAGAPACTISRGPATEPEVVLDYEHSFRAELTVDTHVQHVSSAVTDVLRLVEQLRRDAQGAAPSDALRPAQ